MATVQRGIYYEDVYLGVTVGGLVFSHGTILIDAPLRAEDARSWRSMLLNYRGGTNRLLVNLDAHPDRTLGARAMDCPIVAHQKAALVFRNRPTIFKGQTVETGSAWEIYNDAVGMRWATPDVTFSERMSLHWGGPEVLLEHHPGPTPGSIWVIVPTAHTVFVGDLLVINQPPFLAHGDVDEWLKSLDELQKNFSDYTIISGRGGAVPLDLIRTHQQFLTEVGRGIDRLAKQNVAPEATEELIEPLLARITYPSDQHERYTQRLRYGLYQYYARRFRPSSSLEQSRPEDEEQ